MVVKPRNSARGVSTIPTRFRLSSGTILIVLALLLILMILAVQVFTQGGMNRSSAMVWISFAFNLAIATAALVIECVRAPFSLAQVHWIFIVIFFCVAPASQYANGYANWGYVLSSSTYVSTNMLVLIWEAIFILTHELHLYKSKVINGTAVGDFDTVLDSIKVSHRAVNMLLLASIACTLILVMLVGFTNMFARSTYDTGLDKTSGLVVDKLVRSTPVFAFAFIYLRRRNCHDCNLQLVVAAILLLIADFPFGMARYNMAFVYGGLALLCMPILRKQRGLFATVFLVVFLVLFPASNIFRLNEFDIGMFLQAVGNSLTSLGNGFMTADYDAYSMLARAYSYAATFGPTMGYQLIGALLFFIPRAWWVTKPGGSGQLIAETEGQKYTNLSCPLPGEGMINFGIVGLIIFAAIAAVLIRTIDLRTWKRRGGVIVLPLCLHALILRPARRFAVKFGLFGRLFCYILYPSVARAIALCACNQRGIEHGSFCLPIRDLSVLLTGTLRLSRGDQLD